MRECKAGDGPGHANRKRAIARLFRIGIAFSIEKHCLACRSWRGLAIVNCQVAVIFGEMDHHESAAADVASAWISDRKCKTDRNCRIDRVTAAIEDFDADTCGAL